ncbi:HIRAN domain-containing protein [Streptococcus sp. S784/96/1]|uniref:HIRAN domain-containing protein n=1 Tax=Streptococcus sp. S784/96/1 TaxID=2653499 RepID=UPI001386CC9C|nr:HIRAN domain-containing protein [Streptococcus sp. S784/96/1]
MKEVFNSKFRLMGTNYHQEEATVILSMIGKISSKWEKPNQEILEYILSNYKDLYKYYRVTTTNVELVREPTNKHDRNAVKVMVKNIFAGYLPAEIAKQVNNYLKNQKRYQISAKLSGRGGEFKTLSKNLDKVRKTKKEISFELELVIIDTNKSLLASLFK